MQFRFAKKEDFEQVLEIENLCFKQPYSKEELEYEFYKNPINKIVVAIDENKVVGFIDYLITFNSSTIMQVAVKNEYRRKGIASQLLNEMINSFPKNIDDVVETITLEVRSSNVAAQELYKKNGYEIITTKKQYYKDGEDAIYMLKRL